MVKNSKTNNKKVKTQETISSSAPKHIVDAFKAGEDIPSKYIKK